MRAALVALAIVLTVAVCAVGRRTTHYLFDLTPNTTYFIWVQGSTDTTMARYYTWFTHGLTFTVTSDSGYSVSMVSAEDSTFTGVKPTSTTNVAVYPNPASEHVVVETVGRHDGHFRLYDAAGRLVLERNAIGNASVVRVSHLPSGVYFWRVMDRTGKVVIIH